MFYKMFTKKVYISNVIIFKNEKIFSKMIFLKQVKKNPVATWRKKNHEVLNFTHSKLYFSLIIFVLNPNNKNISF